MNSWNDENNCCCRKECEPHRLFAGPIQLWGDQGDGFYRNPVLPADYSDPDILQKGKNFFLISSTFVQSPGITVLHSEDLINWRILGGAVMDLTQISKNYNWDTMQGYGRGIWAPCITWNPRNGNYYIHFGDPDYGIFMVFTQDIFSGCWSTPRRITLPDGRTFGAGWDDCCVLWDDDGQGYFLANHFADGYKNYIFRLNQNGYTLEDEGVLIHYSGDGLYPKGKEENPEALKIFKKDGYYYIFHNGVINGIRKAFLMRASGIYGQCPDGNAGSREHPGHYEHIPYPIVEGIREPNQGSLIPVCRIDGSTQWYFWTHHGLTGCDGRPDSLIPIVWEKDGWPHADPAWTDEEGCLLEKRIPKPILGTETGKLQMEERFCTDSLPPQWMWNFQPRDSFWSLKERPGFLRLKAFRPLQKDRLNLAGNSLVQRMYRSPESIARMKMDLSGLSDGQFAGMLYLAGSRAAGIGVYQENGIRQMRFLGDEDLRGETVDCTVPVIYLEACWGEEMLVSSGYSFDGKHFRKFGPQYSMQASDYRGGHIGIFCYNNSADSGTVDIEYFTLRW